MLDYLESKVKLQIAKKKETKKQKKQESFCLTGKEDRAWKQKKVWNGLNVTKR